MHAVSLNLQHSPAAGDRLIRKTVGYTEGGEALLDALPSHRPHIETIAHTAPDANPGFWYALWTNSHCEQLVYDQLVGKGFHVLLPTQDVWSRRRGVKRLIPTPMFPDYLFVRTVIDKTSYVEIAKAKGLVCLLGERWDRLTVIPDEEMQAIQRVTETRQPVLPYSYMKEGQRARIVSGPLSGVEGILVETRAEQGLLVLSLHLLQRSVAVVVDSLDVVPA